MKRSERLKYQRLDCWYSTTQPMFLELYNPRNEQTVLSALQRTLKDLREAQLSKSSDLVRLTETLRGPILCQAKK